MSSLTRSVLSLSCLVLFSSVGLRAQASESEGIKSFKNGNFDAAIQQLKKSDDPIELSFLGQAYEAVGKNGDAGKAFERSLKGGFAVFDKALNEWNTSKPSSSLNAALKNLSEILSVSISSTESALRLKAGMARNNEWRVKANALFEIRKLIIEGEEILHPDAVDIKPKTIAMPRPALANTPCHKNNMNTVTVVLTAFFLSDGRTISLIPRSKWNDGCNESAMTAAAGIRFEPAKKDGKAVTVLQAVEYSFSSR